MDSMPLEPGNVAVRATHDRLLPGAFHHAVPPTAIDAVEAVRLHGGDDATHPLGRKRDLVRVTTHEGHESTVRHDRDAVTGEQRAATVGARRPVKHRTTVALAAALN